MRSRVLAVSLLPMLLAICACSTHTPSQPSSAGNSAGAGSSGGTSSTASLTTSIAAPRPLAPAQNAPIRNQDQPVTLVVQNAIVTRSIATTYTFEVATDAAFANKVQVKDGVAEGGGQTGVKLDTLPAAKDYYWHARAIAGSTTGVFGAISKFTIGPAITLNPPAPVGPLSGAQVGVRPAFTVVNAARSGPISGAITYRFEIADNATFTPVLMSAVVPEGSIQTSFTPGSDLTASKTYFWRAFALDLGDSVTSTASQLQVFTATAPTGGGGGSAAKIAADLGVPLWPGVQPAGTIGRATLGDNWGVQTIRSFNGVTFVSPTIEELQVFDLLDRGLDPQSAIDWMHANGYSTSAAYFPSVNVIGFQFAYMTLINGRWDLVTRVGA